MMIGKCVALSVLLTACAQARPIEDVLIEGRDNRKYHFSSEDMWEFVHNYQQGHDPEGSYAYLPKQMIFYDASIEPTLRSCVSFKPFRGDAEWWHIHTHPRKAKDHVRTHLDWISEIKEYVQSTDAVRHFLPRIEQFSQNSKSQAFDIVSLTNLHTICDKIIPSFNDLNKWAYIDHFEQARYFIVSGAGILEARFDKAKEDNVGRRERSRYPVEDDLLLWHLNMLYDWQPGDFMTEDATKAYCERRLSELSKVTDGAIVDIKVTWR